MGRTDDLPKVTPYLIDRAPELCPRRLRLAFQNQRGEQGAFLRGRVRDAVVEDARAAHSTMGPPNPDSFHIRSELLPEEQAVQRMAVDHYVDLFGDDPVQAVDHDDYVRPVERRGVLVGGWIDLVCEDPDDGAELRQFELWGRDVSVDPRDNATLLLATLRLSKWIGERRLRIRLADLTRGRLAEHQVDLVNERGDLVALYEQRLARIQLRTRKPDAVPGESCTACPYVAGCPAFS